MKRSGPAIITTLVLLLLGVIILSWSIYQKRAREPQVENVKVFTDDNFQAEVVEASKKLPILVDFYADWCFPCRMLDPVLEEVAKDVKGVAVIGKVNTDTNLISRRFGISRIPAIFIIRHEEIKNTFYGVVPKETIIQALKENGS
ncbi:MAG TPA: thioredoxin domain-containing protein [Desulfomonilaceae bacterium]|nr:thioredoxin domain-containing protein [Desulfomonilaceae bacterium]